MFLSGFLLNNKHYSSMEKVFKNFLTKQNLLIYHFARIKTNIYYQYLYIRRSLILRLLFLSLTA